MRRFQLLSLASLFIAIGLLSSCQEEEDALLRQPSKDRFKPIATDPYSSTESFIAKSLLISDERTTDILGQEGGLFFRIRPKGCPRSLRLPIGPRCMPGLDFLLTDIEGVRPDRFNFDKGFEGFIRDELTGSVVAQLTDVLVDPNRETFTLRYTATGDHEVASEQLLVSFKTLYVTDESAIEANFEGTVTSEVTEYLQ